MRMIKIHMNKVCRNTLNFLNKWDFENKFFQVPRDRLGLRDPTATRPGLYNKNLYNNLEHSAPSTPPRRPQILNYKLGHPTLRQGQQLGRLYGVTTLGRLREVMNSSCEKGRQACHVGGPTGCNISPLRKRPLLSSGAVRLVPAPYQRLYGRPRQAMGR